MNEDLVISNESNRDEAAPLSGSPVWAYFIKNKEKLKTECKLCRAKFSVKSSTYTLKRHIESIHPAEFRIMQGSSTVVGPIETFFKPKVKPQMDESEQKDLVKFIVDTMQPFNIVSLYLSIHT